MNYVVDKETLLQEQIKGMYKFRQSFVRRNRSKWNHKNDQRLETSALRIRKDYSNFIEAAENEVQSPRQKSFGEDFPSRKSSAQDSPTRTILKSIGEGIDIDESVGRGKERSPSKAVKSPKKDVKKPVKGTFEVGFDAVMSYKDYFPVNNVEYVIDKMNEKLRLARKMKRMKAIRRVIMFTSAARKATMKKKTEVVSPSHDYGVGTIKFTRGISKYEENNSEGTEPEAFMKGIPEASEEENEEKKVKIAEEEVKFNKDSNQENEEFNKKLEFKLLNEVKTLGINDIMPDFVQEDKDEEVPDIVLKINLVNTNEDLDRLPELKEPETKTNSTAERDYNLVSQAEINRLLSHVIDKYGTGYVRDIISKKESDGDGDGEKKL